MRSPSVLLCSCLLLCFTALSPVLGKSVDPYKALGVERTASQREIQKAFHKLSLQYHPDKNKKKGAQEKFAEISNAYEILADEEKRKNYDLYGDEKGNTGFQGGDFGSGHPDGYTYFTSGPQSGGQGDTGFSFSFSGGENPFGGFGDIFSSFFGSGSDGTSKGGFTNAGGHGSGFTSGFGRAGGSKSKFSSSGSLENVNQNAFNQKVKDKGLTWLLLFYTPSAKGHHLFQSIVEDAADILPGAIKAGHVNCQKEKALCKELAVKIHQTSRLFVYSYKNNVAGSLIEYSGDSDAKSLRNFVEDQLPKYSKRVDLSRFDFLSSTGELPELLLLSKKKSTPVMWSVLSGIYRKLFTFYDAQVLDSSHPTLRSLGVESLPAVVGRLANRQVYVLRSGIVVKDLESGINELRALLESFKKKNKGVASEQAKKNYQAEQKEGKVIHLSASNVESLCGDKTALCIIGVYKSKEAKEKMDIILSLISQKSFLRQKNPAEGLIDSISYSLLDGTTQSSFLRSFDKYGFRSSDRLLLAYKPKKQKFASCTNELTLEEVEKFVGSVLNGDIRFSKVPQKPVLR